MLQNNTAALSLSLPTRFHRACFVNFTNAFIMSFFLLLTFSPRVFRLDFGALAGGTYSRDYTHCAWAFVFFFYAFLVALVWLRTRSRAWSVSMSTACWRRNTWLQTLGGVYSWKTGNVHVLIKCVDTYVAVKCYNRLYYKTPSHFTKQCDFYFFPRFRV